MPQPTLRRLSPFLLLATGACLSLPAVAGPGHAHEHGVTHLDLVLDGGVLAVRLQAAGQHIVGFEHVAETDEQRAAVAAAKDVLANGATLFSPAAAAQCRLQKAEVTAPGATGAQHDHGHGHGHDHGHRHGHGGGHAEAHATHATGADHGHHDNHGNHGNRPAHAHGDGHGHGGHADHGAASGGAAHGHHGHGHHDHHEHGAHHDAGHGDWTAEYRFECARPAALAQIDLGLFEAFPATTEIRFQLLAPHGQAGGALDAGRARIAVPQGR